MRSTELMGASGARSKPTTCDESSESWEGGPATSAAASFVSRLTFAADSDGADFLHPQPLLHQAEPALGLAIVTCMDARLDLHHALGIRTGDAHILRNAGGRMTPDVIRSLHLSVKIMNVREIGIVHHTGCALEGIDNVALADRTGTDNIDFLPFRSVQDSLTADVQMLIKADILRAQGIVWGAVYLTPLGRLSELHGPFVVEQ